MRNKGQKEIINKKLKAEKILMRNITCKSYFIWKQMITSKCTQQILPKKKCTQQIIITKFLIPFFLTNQMKTKIEGQNRIQKRGTVNKGNSAIN